jgi:hypothetical protein
MSDVIREFRYTLTTSFQYAYEGEALDATYLMVSAPKSKHSKPCAQLKQGFLRALADAEGGGDDAKAAGPPELTGELVIMMLGMSKNVELADMLEVGRTLFTSGLVMVDGVTKLSKSLADEMTQEDWEALLGDFMANFTVRSVLSMMTTKT